MKPVHSTLLRRALLLGAPLVLGVLELTHPNPADFPGLAAQVDWWIMIHLIQLPLFGLLGLAVDLLTANLRGPLANLSRLAVGAFLVLYPTFDVLEGLAVGVLVRLAAGLPAEQQAGAYHMVQLFQDQTNGDVIALLGIFAWLVAILAGVAALARGGAPRLAVILIGLGGLAFGLGHPAPTGTVGMALFLVGVTTLEWRIPASVRRALAPAAASVD